MASKTNRTTYRTGEREEERVTKKENMNIIICPAERLVAKRIVRVSGRIT